MVVVQIGLEFNGCSIAMKSKVMKSEEKTVISVQVVVNKPIEMVWNSWTMPEHIINWNFASDDWFCPQADNSLAVGDKFSYRMESKDGEMGFDFWGVYNQIIKNEIIDCTLGDGRRLHITFSEVDNQTTINEKFEAENENSIELQKTGWQAILDNFKKYTESDH